MAMTGPRLKREVEQLFEVVRNRCTTTEIVFLCPTCPSSNPDRSGNRSVNLKTGATSCWRCGKGFKSFVYFCRSIGMEIDDEGHADPDISESEKLLEDFDKLNRGTIVPLYSSCKLPKGFTPIQDKPNSVYSELIGEMAVKKHLTWEDMVAAGVGFTREDDRWEPYAIFPVIEWENIVYYQGRLYDAEPGVPTKRFPNNSETPLGSRYWVYNIDAARVRKASRVIVVESILNVLSLEKKFKAIGETDIAAVCVFKHKISRAQVAKLLALRHLKEICVCYDADSTKHAIAEASRLTNHRLTTIAEIPAVNGAKTFDVNDDVDLGWECYLKRRRVNSPVDVLDYLASDL